MYVWCKKYMHTMKTTTTLIFASFLALTFSVSNVYSQLVAIGHVSAEVVESVSAASAIVTNFKIGSATDNESKSLELAYLNSESIDLGAITIQSGKDIACNVVLKQASVSDALGNSFTLDPSLKSDSASQASISNGSQTIQLDGKANLSDNQASGLYQGSCTVIFAYN